MLSDKEKEAIKVTLINLKKADKFRKINLFADIFSSLFTLILFILYGSLYIDSEGSVSYLWLVGSIAFFTLSTFGFLHTLDSLFFKYFNPNKYSWMNSKEILVGVIFDIATQHAINEIKKIAIEEGIANG